jgi:DNA-binding CsgD family transcriptional regulator
MTQPVPHRAARALRTMSSAPIRRLTDREIDVLRLIALGYIS